MNKAPSETQWDGHCPQCSVRVSGTNPAALGVILFLHSQSHDEKLSLSQARSLVKVVSHQTGTPPSVAVAPNAATEGGAPQAPTPKETNA